MTPVHFALMAGFSLLLVGIALNRTHLLSALLCLEGMMLALFLTLALWTLQLNLTNFATSPMLLLALSACEASLGLSILVATSRNNNTMNLKNLTSLRC